MILSFPLILVGCSLLLLSDADIWLFRIISRSYLSALNNFFFTLDVLLRVQRRCARFIQPSDRIACLPMLQEHNSTQTILLRQHQVEK